LEKRGNIKFFGFGNFLTREKHPRRKRNLQPGEEAIIAGRRVLTFKSSVILRKVVD
jgi:nucleoid DNA-binding protein